MSFTPAPCQKLVKDWSTVADSSLVIVGFGKNVLIAQDVPNSDVFRFPTVGELRHASHCVRAKKLLWLGTFMEEVHGETVKTECYGFECPEYPDFSEIAGKSAYIEITEPTQLAELTAIMDPFFEDDEEQKLEKSCFVAPSRYVLATFLEPSASALCRARELLFWRKMHRRCGRCGEKLTESTTDMALVCETCHARYYPQIAPAVIVLVTRKGEGVQEEQVLLGHNRNFYGRMYSLIAGFVEAGESAEEAVRRELREETGIEVKNITYRRSQCWPYPFSLMLGFRAEYASGEARGDGVELDDVQWFSRGSMPMIPQPGSIAYRLLTEWIEEK